MILLKIPPILAFTVTMACFEPTPEPGLPCTSDGWCPPGQTCYMERQVCIPNDGFQSCGNGYIDQLEEMCDDGNTISGDGCSADCASDETCGNGIVDIVVNEQCDDNNTVAGDGCSTGCMIEICGNGIIDFGEVCDDLNTISGDGCSANCLSDETCGNGYRDINEACDDGNNASRDGCSNTCITEELLWIDMSPTGDSPTSRQNHTMVYEAAHQRIILFGGLLDRGNDDPDIASQDTWAWNGAIWIELVSEASPSARTEHAMTYDSNRDRVVLFGGSDESGVQDDTWEWDGSAWEEKIVELPVPRRHRHAMAYDTIRKRTVVFGGTNGGLLDDTWEWDGTTWSEVTPETGPGPRYNHAMAYDPVRQTVVLFGGIDDMNIRRNDTWEFNGTTWDDVTPSPPGPESRFGHDMAYDPTRGRVVLFGGVRSDGVRLNDIWEWTGVSWDEVSLDGVLPAVRQNHALAYDSMRRRLVLFGGRGNAGITFGDAWEFGYNDL